MAYEVIARKWRPQQFDDVVGQEHVTRTLQNAIKNDRVAHAYLFVGPRGTGKTTTARILAKALNCDTGPTTTPCDTCDSCREIMEGRNLDVLEIDGASNNGVDQVRDLRDNARYAPARGPYKVYIIDEVHMLTIAAFNALLKTLEEPPPHVKFVFATTEPQKVPATILSRCQRFDLRPIMTRAIMGRLREIATAEEIDIDDDALLAVARAAEGGLRDAQSALDQLIAFRGKKIREEDVMAVFGLMARKTLEELAGAILGGRVPEAIDIVARLDQAGKDMQRVVVELLEYFRNVLVVIYAGEKSESLDLLEDQIEAVKRQAEETAAGRVLRVIEILTEADQRLRYALSKRALLDVAVIRAARAAGVATVEELVGQINRLKESLGGAGDPGAQKKSSGPAYSVERSAESGVREAGPTAAAAATPAPAPLPEEETADAGDEAKLLAARWHDVVDRVGRTAQLARGYLLDAKPVSVSGDKVTIGFDPEFAGNKEKIDFPRNVKALQNVLREILGRPVSVTFTVLSAKDTLPGDIKIRKDVNAGAAALKSGKRTMSMQARDQWVHNESVQKALELFGGDIIDIRE